MKTRKIVSVGDVAVDHYINLDIHKLGGISLNFALNVLEGLDGRGKVSLVAPLGKDKFGSWIKENIDGLGIETKHVGVLNGDTPKQKIILKDNGERRFVGYSAGVLKDWRLTRSDVEFIKKHDVVFVPLSDGMEKVFKTISKIDKVFKAVDFSQDYEHADLDLDKNIVTKYSVMFDLIFVGGKPCHIDLMRMMSVRYPNKIFVLTLGSEGSVAFNKGMEYKQLAIKVRRLVDTTGCGDAFQGAFVAEYLRSKNIQKSLMQGSKRASVVIGQIGATGIDVVI